MKWQRPEHIVARHEKGQYKCHFSVLRHNLSLCSMNRTIPMLFSTVTKAMFRSHDLLVSIFPSFNSWKRISRSFVCRAGRVDENRSMEKITPMHILCQVSSPIVNNCLWPWMRKLVTLFTLLCSVLHNLTGNYMHQ